MHESTSNSTYPSPTDETRLIAAALAETSAEAALAVAPYLRRVARSAPEVGLKRDKHDPVTVHDRKVEDDLRQFLTAAAPGSRILGEEMGEETGAESGEDRAVTAATAAHTKAQRDFLNGLGAPVRDRLAPLGSRVRWIIDPIDGTANFAAGMTYFGTSIGVELDGHVVAGAVSIPFNHELFAADLDVAWHLDGEGVRSPISSVGPEHESEAVLSSYYPSVSAINTDPNGSLENSLLLMNAYSTVRRPGAGALDLALVAAGWMGAVIATTFQPWDAAAGLHLIRVAGGRVLNLPLGTDHPDGLRPGIVASVGSMRATTAEGVLHDLERQVNEKV